LVTLHNNYVKPIDYISISNFTNYQRENKMTVNGWKVSDDIAYEVVYFYRDAAKAGFKVERVIHWANKTPMGVEVSWYDLQMFFGEGEDKIEIKFRPVREGNGPKYDYSLITFGDENLTDPKAIKFLETYKKEPMSAHLTVAEFFMNYVPTTK